MAAPYLIENRHDGTPISLVIGPDGLYLLPEGRLANLLSCPVWCEDCDRFRAGECLETLDEIRTRIRDLESEPPDEIWRFVFGDDSEKRRRAAASARRRLHWRETRRSPPRCLCCDSVSISPLDGNDPASMTDPRTGCQVTLSPVFLDSDLSDRLLLLTAEGDRLGEISRFGRDHEFIDDSYPYEFVVARLEAARRDSQKGHS